MELWLEKAYIGSYKVIKIYQLSYSFFKLLFLLAYLFVITPPKKWQSMESWYNYSLGTLESNLAKLKNTGVIILHS